MQPDCEGNTLLHYAAANGDKPMLDLLFGVCTRENLHCQNAQGLVPYWTAIRAGHPEVAPLLQDQTILHMHREGEHM